ncbi:nose resistant to fluoxetine protein 6-like [Antedon mediterranea]|uniref:nose resistant to fluoxetine protein 6-like n=1 Tax=Antedon mediterranea TaxID=105859 RepID=UPI003AF8E555
MVGNSSYLLLCVACIVALPTFTVSTAEIAFLPPEARQMFKDFGRLDIGQVERNVTHTTGILKDILVRLLAPDYIDAIKNAKGVSEECKENFLTYIEDKQNNEDYANRMYYSNGDRDFMRNLYRFNFANWGNYELCTNVYEYAYAPFKTKQCAIGIPFYVPTKTAICVPASCSKADVRLLTIAVIDERPLPDLLEIKKNGYYECIDMVPWSAGAIVSMTIISVLAALVIVGTSFEMGRRWFKQEPQLPTGKPNPKAQPITNHAYTKDDDLPKESEEIMKAKDGFELDNDYKHRSSETSSGIGTDSETLSDNRQVDDTTAIRMEVVQPSLRQNTSCEKFITKFLMCFSATTNGTKVLNVSNSGGQLNCLNGIRVLSMWWVILGHSLLFILGHIDDYAYIDRMIGQSFTFQAITNASFSVDSFFVLSGLLLTYHTFKHLNKTNGRMNWALFYFHRYWRITPLYMIAIAIHANLFVYFGKGLSMIGFAEYMHYACEKYWWTNLLYINNLVPFPGNLGEQCLSWSWYLANDMQFFAISPLIFLLLWKNWKVGFASISSLCVLSFAATASITKYWGLPADGSWDNAKYNNRTYESEYPDGDRIYGKPYCRIPAYLVGVSLGYILYKIDKKKLRIPKVAILLGWCAAIATGLAVVYGLWNSHKGEQLPQASAVVYNTLSRFAWSVAVAWVIFACVTGYGGFVNNLLSWGVWSPLARLSFGAYLFHPIVIYAVILTWKTEMHLTIPNLSTFYISNIVLSYAAAFVMSILVEGPFASMEKLMFGKAKRE